MPFKVYSANEGISQGADFGRDRWTGSETEIERAETFLILLATGEVSAAVDNLPCADFGGLHLGQASNCMPSNPEYDGATVDDDGEEDEDFLDWRAAHPLVNYSDAAGIRLRNIRCDNQCSVTINVSSWTTEAALGVLSFFAACSPYQSRLAFRIEGIVSSEGLSNTVVFSDSVSIPLNEGPRQIEYAFDKPWTYSVNVPADAELLIRLVFDDSEGALDLPDATDGGYMGNWCLNVGSVNYGGFGDEPFGETDFGSEPPEFEEIES